MEWVELIRYIDAGALIAIVFLFIKGFIVSKYTVTSRDKAHKETLEKVCENHKETLEKVCENHKETIKMITASFEKSIKNLKDVIKIFKKRNGIK